MKENKAYDAIINYTNISFSQKCMEYTGPKCYYHFVNTDF